MLAQGGNHRSSSPEYAIKHLLSTLSHSPGESIPVSCRTWSETKATYRCFSSDKVSADKIMAPHKEKNNRKSPTV